MIRRVRTWLKNLVPVSLALLMVACGGEKGHEDHDHSGGSSGHHHEPPHGGTAVAYGDEDFHVEFVPDVSRRIIEVYFFTPHMAEFMRVPLESFSVTFKSGATSHETEFRAHASNATGETVGDTSMFVADAAWLKSGSSVAGTIDEIELFGRRYEKMQFEMTLP